ncbi:hypothetical protein MANES_03G089519v8 [Manihot esculenta]|uniref:Uncharacterized protein n=2 Tax=Manihot esculenta TaxID=3983 RepID=A0ACB7HZW5_MANES|nr:hypothetical protein MANES_13G093344v8 [Manihot esculenta]KAG8657780.1 hypothetical protein MANES_03G089519v8 [Manihot esculenta]
MVRTLAGNGTKGSDYKGGGKGTTQLLNSPWDVCYEPVNEKVYIAMAGQHQIWEHNTLDGVTIAFSGDGYERNLNGSSVTFFEICKSLWNVDCPSLFPEILKTLFEIVLFEDCGNQWSLNRPMLSLILISEQPVDQPQRLSLCFDKLMADVTRSLDAKNSDRFTQNLTVFRHEIRVK